MWAASPLLFIVALLQVLLVHVGQLERGTAGIELPKHELLERNDVRALRLQAKIGVNFVVSLLILAKNGEFLLLRALCDLVGWLEDRLVRPVG